MVGWVGLGKDHVPAVRLVGWAGLVSAMFCRPSLLMIADAYLVCATRVQGRRGGFSSAINSRFLKRIFCVDVFGWNWQTGVTPACCAKIMSLPPFFVFVFSTFALCRRLQLNLQYIGLSCFLVFLWDYLLAVLVCTIYYHFVPEYKDVCMLNIHSKCF